jgi:hypothetical protein
MKKIYPIIFVTILILSSIRPSPAQTYWPLPDSDAIWKVTYVYDIPPPIWGYNLYYHYDITGDTVVNGIVYRQLISTHLNACCTQIILYQEYAGAFRNDITEKKVFYLPPGHDHDTLLYDFSLSVGDTLPVSYVHWDFPILYVQNIDSVLVNENYHKRFFLVGEYGVQALLIEGVGSASGLLENVYFFEEGGTLQCFEWNDTLNGFGFPWISCGPLPTDTCYVGIKNIKNNDKYMTIYPNPCSTGNIFIKTNNLSLPLDVEIYNTYGSLMKQFRMRQNEFDVSLDGFSKGVYMVIVHSKSGLFNAKFVIN